jgi:hypothetical protein
MKANNGERHKEGAASKPWPPHRTKTGAEGTIVFCICDKQKIENMVIDSYLLAPHAYKRY